MISLYIKKLLLCGIASTLPCTALAGTPSGSIDARLKLWTSRPETLLEHKGVWRQPSSGHALVHAPLVDVIFRTTDSSDPAALVQQHGGTLRSVIGTICTAELPISRIEEFAAQPGILRVEASQEMRLHNEEAKKTTGADKVHTAQLPEGRAYTGKGVLVGIIDTGIDFLHPDFREKDNADACRVISVWDQTALAGVLPQNYSYGAEWTQAEIQAEVDSPIGTVTERDSSGHGTHVAGTAAGLRGMAYDAHIIAVKTPLVSNGDYKFATSAKTLDAVKYIYEKAVALNKPCVVNMSLGFNFGAPHDGTSLFEQGIDQLVGSRPGFIVCASAGNEGTSYSHHGGYALTPDSVWTYVNGLNGATWYGVSPSAYDDSIYVSVIVDSATASFTGQGILNQKRLFQTPWIKLADIRDTTEFFYPVFYGNGETAATIRLVATAYDQERTELYIYPRDPFVVSTDVAQARVNLYKIAVRGAGTFHSWIEPLNGLGVNLANFRAKTDKGFKASDDNYTIGIPATAHNVIAVGAYINRASYTDIRGQKQVGLNYNNRATGTLAFFSSIGPTLDGRRKPEFAAPGLNVASSLSRYADVDSTSMTDSLTAVFSGTSMSCPVTSGAIALYLEQHPEATYADVVAALDSTTTQDNATKSAGALPNNVWGYGKLNIFEAMGGLPATSIAEYASAPKALVFPHPARASVTLSLPEGQWRTLVVTDMAGRTVLERSVTEHQFSLPTQTWSTGVYLYYVEGAGKALRGEFIVE